MNNSNLRAVVATIDQQITSRPGAGDDGLSRSWSKLVALLALGPEPKVRSCPHCGEVGMRAATRCGRCWRELTPPVEAATAAL